MLCSFECYIHHMKIEASMIRKDEVTLQVSTAQGVKELGLYHMRYTMGLLKTNKSSEKQRAR